jgi:hypothetical protein
MDEHIKEEFGWFGLEGECLRQKKKARKKNRLDRGGGA